MGEEKGVVCESLQVGLLGEGRREGKKEREKKRIKKNKNKNEGM